MYTRQYKTIQYTKYHTIHNTIQCNTIQYNTPNTTQYTTPYNTIQYNKYCTVNFGSSLITEGTNTIQLHGNLQTDEYLQRMTRKEFSYYSKYVRKVFRLLTKFRY